MTHKHQELGPPCGHRSGIRICGCSVLDHGVSIVIRGIAGRNHAPPGLWISASPFSTRHYQGVRCDAAPAAWLVSRRRAIDRSCGLFGWRYLPSAIR